MKADLGRDVRLGVIEPVPPGTPTVWRSKMILIPKKDGIKKFHFIVDSVDFAGFTLSPTRIKSAEEILQAIRDFPVSTTITDARSWFGLINLAAYAFANSNVYTLF